MLSSKGRRYKRLIINFESGVHTTRSITSYEALTSLFGLVNIVLLVSAVALFAYSMVNYFLIKDSKKCTMENCVLLAPKCGINICESNGDCTTLPDIPGCANPGENVTAQNPSSNYAFQSICYSQIGLCQPSISNEMMEQPLHIEVNTTKEQLRINGKSVDSIVKTTSSDQYTNIVMRHIDSWDSKVHGQVTFVIKSKFLPINTTHVDVVINYDDVDIPGQIEIHKNGVARLRHYDTVSGSLSYYFNCECIFYDINLVYFSY